MLSAWAVWALGSGPSWPILAADELGRRRRRRRRLETLAGSGRLTYRKVGKHRRLRVEDVLSFKQTRDKDRRAGLRELSQLTQELGGYDAEVNAKVK